IRIICCNIRRPCHCNSKRGYYNKKRNKCFVTAASTAAVQRLYVEVFMPEFRLTYSTMFTPPPELHEFFDRALVRVGKAENREHPLFIGGCDVFTDRKSVNRSPIDQ